MTGTKPLSSFDLPCPVEQLAIFLDFDGTLADIVDHPDDVHLPGEMIEALDMLAKRTSGALAIVTGRPIEQIDRLLSPLVLPVAGVHGMARRAFDGKLHTADHDPSVFAEVQARMTHLHTEHADTMIEIKPGSIAFHYRRRPDLSETVAELVHEALGDLDGIDILHGKMVVEVKTGHANKGSAIRAFMEEPPFADRVAVFAGDDVTDEFGFQAVAEIGGVAIKIGSGETRAKLRTDTPAEFRDWLAATARDLA
ncbi:trehalose-phosphatase [Aliihoeflea aestuarii]|jgi:trehalose 6-phosphate phosphatase|uniref:trehalose-phosphatase n=1 Tax=Aliihoeflea aestuarii TaxID=453840 RepID=UPI002093A8B4|nr:trehalose-phosphatase [Aliihoeflea aestuarii]MCO6390789.1 trehalose-phosphatase [Aliihoeflea aestuarii]